MIPGQKTSPNSCLGQMVGDYTIEEFLYLDRDTALISCQPFMTDFGTAHLEAEHWLDENTFHYNTLYYDENGDFIFSESEDLKPEHMRTFERIFSNFETC